MNQSKQSSRLNASHLPRLAFGERHASVHRDLDAYREALKHAVVGLECFDTPRRGMEFAAKSSIVTIGGLKFVSNASTPLEVKVTDGANYNLLLPVSGENLSAFDGVEHRWDAGIQGVLLPPGDRWGLSGTRSVVTVDLDPKRLQDTVEAMLGEEVSSVVQSRLNSGGAVPLHYGHLDFESALLRYYGVIDGFLDDHLAIGRLGLDDGLYRLLGMMLFPELLTSGRDERGRPDRRAQILETLCEYIRANIGDRHSLTDLERRSGFSERTLQNMFNHKFGVSPRDWILEQRLLEAHNRIRRGDYESLSGLALDLGFHSGSHFSRAYKQRFGVSPRSMAQRTWLGWSSGCVLICVHALMSDVMVLM